MRQKTTLFFLVLWDALPLSFCKHAKLTVIACSALYGLLDEPVTACGAFTVTARQSDGAHRALGEHSQCM